jgi:hypothetical protein
MPCHLIPASSAAAIQIRHAPRVTPAHAKRGTPAERVPKLYRLERLSLRWAEPPTIVTLREKNAPPWRGIARVAAQSGSMRSRLPSGWRNQNSAVRPWADDDGEHYLWVRAWLVFDVMVAEQGRLV